MKKILIFTYYWPPSGGAAVQRWLSFANKLAENDFEVHVITVDEKYATYQLLDESLLEKVHPSIKVYSTKTIEPFKLFAFIFGKKSLPKPAFSNEPNPSFVKKVSRFIRGNFFIPDPRKGWKPFALERATQVIEKKDIRCVITAGPPHSTHFIGKTLKEKYGLYWVADFHDLWTDVIYYDMLYHLPVVKRMDQRFERSILEAADAVITVGDKYAKKLLTKSNKLLPQKIKVLRIGYDESLFEGIKEHKPQTEFIITYAGTIADYYRPEVFIHALKIVVEKFPEVTFRLRFAGILSENIRKEIIDAGLVKILTYVGYLSHTESLALLKTTSILLLVNPVTKDEEMVIPGKIYEYLAAGKPIINISKPGAETATIISKCGAGETFDRNQKVELVEYLTTLVLQWKKIRNLDIENNGEQVHQYSRMAITKSLIGVIEDHV